MRKGLTYEVRSTLLSNALKGDALVFTPLTAADPKKYDTFRRVDEEAWPEYCGRTANEMGTAREELATSAARRQGTTHYFMLQQKPNGPYVGNATVTFAPGKRTAEIGYFVLPSFRRQHVASQVAEIIPRRLASVSKQLGIDEVIATVNENNAFSIGVMRKAHYAESGASIPPSGRPGKFVRFGIDLGTVSPEPPKRTPKK